MDGWMDVLSSECHMTSSFPSQTWTPPNPSFSIGPARPGTKIPWRLSRLATWLVPGRPGRRDERHIPNHQSLVVLGPWVEKKNTSGTSTEENEWFSSYVLQSPPLKGAGCPSSLAPPHLASSRRPAKGSRSSWVLASSSTVLSGVGLSLLASERASPASVLSIGGVRSRCVRRRCRSNPRPHRTCANVGSVRPVSPPGSALCVTCRALA
jgi:hypothetical protein